MKKNSSFQPIVVNLVAGPGTGKSSTMATIFGELKWANVNCEMAPEYAKEQVWAGSVKVLRNQIYVFGKQHHKIARLADQVDVIITDSPLILSLIYGAHMSETFKCLVREEFNRYTNMTYFLKRVKPFNPKGRLQDEEEAREIDGRLKRLLDGNEIPYSVMKGEKKTGVVIAKQVIAALKARSLR